MEIQSYGSIRMIPSDGNSFSSSGCRAFYREGESVLYYTDKKDDIALPGFARVYAYDYFRDLLILESMRSLTEFFQEHDDDSGFYRTEQFWQDAMKYAGRPVVPLRVTTHLAPKQGMVRFILSIVADQHDEMDCCYDLEAGRIVLSNRKGGEVPTLAEFFYGNRLLLQMTAQRQHARDMAPAVYGELCRINDFLAGKQTIHAQFQNGKLLQCYRRVNLHAGELFKVKDGEIIPHCYNYIGNPPVKYGLPLKFTHKNSEFVINCDVLRSLEVDLTADQIEAKQRASLLAEIRSMIGQEEKYAFSHVSLHSGTGERLEFYTAVYGITRDSLPDLPEAVLYFRQNCAGGKIEASVASITLGIGEDTPPPADLMRKIGQMGCYQLYDMPGHTCEHDFLRYEEEELFQRFIVDKGLPRETQQKLLAGKIKGYILSGMAYTFCDVTVKLPNETKQALLPGHIENEEEAAMLPLLRRLRFRHQDIPEFTVEVRNGVIGAGSEFEIDDELLQLVRQYGGCDCIEEIGARLDFETYHVSADDIPLDEYKQRRLDRIARYRERSSAAQQRGDALINRSFKMVEHIPPGQPILVGHHSEGRHRRDLDRSWNTLGKGVGEHEKAGYYADKAVSAELNTAISSDDPDALDELREKLENMEKKQEQMKERNRYYRKNGTCKGCPGVTDELAAKLDHDVKTGYSWERQPYPSYELTNNGANIRRVRDRIEGLQKLRDNPIAGWEFEGGRVVANDEINRLQIYFDEVPDKEYRQRLSREWSFKFSRANDNAWQRQLNWNAVRAAKRALTAFAERNSETA